MVKLQHLNTADFSLVNQLFFDTYNTKDKKKVKISISFSQGFTYNMGFTPTLSGVLVATEICSHWRADDASVTAVAGNAAIWI